MFKGTEVHRYFFALYTVQRAIESALALWHCVETAEHILLNVGYTLYIELISRLDSRTLRPVNAINFVSIALLYCSIVKHHEPVQKNQFCHVWLFSSLVFIVLSELANFAPVS